MDLRTDLREFAVRWVPEIAFGAGRSCAIAEDAAELGHAGKPVCLVTDAALVELGVIAPLIGRLEEAGAGVAVFADIAGEPKEKDMDAATEFVRGHDAGLVICMGGGSAMDIGKVAAAVAPTGRSPIEFSMEGDPVPGMGLPKICIPTTAGTGSECSSTNIFTRSDGKKVWVWSTDTKPDRIILDPELTVSLPANLTAWTGLDAFAHALESSTNVRRHHLNDLYAHKALALIAGSLERAVTTPTDVAARGDMLLGSALAGISIDNCSAAFAHNISHALAALAPVHHGLATGLALEILLPWQVEEDTGPFAAAAAACGLEPSGAALAAWYSDFMTRCGVERRLPEVFRQFETADLVREMQAPETQYMRRSTVRHVSDADIERFAGEMLALA